MSGYQALNANYGGRLPNQTSYIKNFNDGSDPSLWTLQKYNYKGIPKLVIIPASARANSVYIPGDLFVDGSIVSPSDINLKDNIININENGNCFNTENFEDFYGDYDFDTKKNKKIDNITGSINFKNKVFKENPYLLLTVLSLILLKILVSNIVVINSNSGIFS